MLPFEPQLVNKPTKDLRAGIYVHIPYCKQACSYCNFYFSTNQKTQKELAHAIALEVEQQRTFFDKRTIDTLYFGGGTPSILKGEYLKDLVSKISTVFDLSTLSEFTFECNPDDISKENLTFWRALGINRLSIGIQSLTDEHLKLMNRSHDRNTAINSIGMAIDHGFEDLTIDFIYGIPGQTEDELRESLDLLNRFSIRHFSAYALTVEPNTLLDRQVKKGQVEVTPDATFRSHFDLVKNFARDRGFIQYELSNFAQPGHEATHNSSYWSGSPYLGLGPAAHSFKGNQRFWNKANVYEYIKALKNDNHSKEYETLSNQDQFNEYIITRVRTAAGIDMDWISKNFPDFYVSVKSESETLVTQGMMKHEKNIFTLTDDGQFLCDHLSQRLMV